MYSRAVVGYARTVLAAAVAMALAVTGIGCGTTASAPTVPADQTLTVGIWTGGPITITVPARIDHRQPQAYHVLRPWLPVLEAAPEGARLAAGDLILAVDADVANRWRDNELRVGAAREADARRARLLGERSLIDLRERLADVQGRIAVADAAIAATRVRDETVIAIARQQLADAQARLAQARAEQQRLHDLAAAVAVNPRSLQRAAAEAALAAAEVAGPALNLEILEQTTNAITRRRRTLDRERLNAEASGVQAELAAVDAGEQRAGFIDDKDIEQRRAQIEEFAQVIAAPVIMATDAGVLRYAKDFTGRGSKPGWNDFADVLDPSGLVVVAQVADRWRPWLRVDEASSPPTVSITVPALGRSIPGRVVAIAAQPENAADGTGSVFQIQIQPLAALDLLLPGSTATCAIELDISGEHSNNSALASLPAWAIPDPRHPQVTAEDGSVRTLTGLRWGHSFLIMAGVAPGEKVVPIGIVATAAERLVGIIEPVQFHPVRVSTRSYRDNWRIRWLIADGSTVTAGQPVAGLTYSGWGDPAERRFAVAYAELEAEARLTRTRSEVAAKIGRAAAAWRQALVAADSARFEVLVSQLEGEDPARLARQAEVVRQENTLRSATTRIEELAVPGVADALSAHAAAALRIAGEQAQLRLLRARLDAVAAQRSDDYVSVRETAAAARDAQAELAKSRFDYLIARLEGQAQLARAEYDRRQSTTRMERDRQRVNGEELRAPLGGIIYQSPRPNGRLLQIGDWLDLDEPFVIPTGSERKAVFEVTDHLAAQWTQGQELAVVIPALGAQSRPGRISQIGRALVSSRRNRGEEWADARVVLVTVVFSLDAEENQRAPLGSTVYADQ